MSSPQQHIILDEEDEENPTNNNDNDNENGTSSSVEGGGEAGDGIIVGGGGAARAGQRPINVLPHRDDNFVSLCIGVRDGTRRIAYTDKTMTDIRAEALGRCLNSSKSKVQELVLNLTNLTTSVQPSNNNSNKMSGNTKYPSLLIQCAKNPKIQHVRLTGLPHGYGPPIPLHISTRFLAYLSKNTNLKTLDLFNIQVSTKVLTHILKTSSSLRKLQIAHCPFYGGSAQELGQAFAANKSLQDLDCICQSARFVTAACSQATNIQKLKVTPWVSPLFYGNDNDDDASTPPPPVVSQEYCQAVGDCLSHSPVESLELAGWHFRNSNGNGESENGESSSSSSSSESLWTPLAQGMINCETLADISFSNCGFDGATSELLLESFPMSVKSLSISSVTEFGSDATFLGRFFTEHGPHITKSLEIEVSNMSNMDPDAFFTALRTSLTKLDTLDLGYIQTIQQCRGLIDALPYLPVRTLLIDIDDKTCGMCKDALLQALHINTYLTHVEIGFADLLDKSDDEYILDICMRNSLSPEHNNDHDEHEYYEIDTDEEEELYYFHDHHDDIGCSTSQLHNHDDIQEEGQLLKTDDDPVSQQEEGEGSTTSTTPPAMKLLSGNKRPYSPREEQPEPEDPSSSNDNDYKQPPTKK